MTMIRICAILMLVAFTAACTKPLFKPRKVTRHDHAGSVQVAVLSVAPWSKVAKSLQPEFDITPKSAIDESIPATQHIIERLLDVLRASLKVATPTVGVTETRTTTGRSGTDPVEELKQTEERKPGDVSKVTATDVGTGRTVPAPFEQPKLDLKAIDPLLRYQAATALYQEVKILSQYVANAMKREGYTPHLVRLQVGVMPHARDLAYDTYANISFFTAVERMKRSDVLEVAGGSRIIGPTAQFATVLEPPYRGSSPSARTVVMKHPVVVPLLVTDNLESAIHERSIQTVRQAAFGLLAMLKGVGLSADVGKLSDELNAVLGKDVNSLFTVARMSDNTVRVRFGGMNQAGAGYAMVPRTHHVSLLVLIPDRVRHVKVMTRSEFRDVDTGEPLEHRSSAEVLLPMIEKIWDKYNLAKPVHKDTYYRIANAVYFNDFAGFADLMRKLQPDAAAAYDGRRPELPLSRLNLFTYVWTDLVGTRVGSGFSQAAFDVPRETAEASAVCPRTQTPVLVDDTTRAVSTTLAAGQNLDASKLGAVLEITCPSAPALTFAPETFAVAAEGRNLQLGFASLARVSPADCLKANTMTVKLDACVPTELAARLTALDRLADRTRSSLESLEQAFQDFLEARASLQAAHLTFETSKAHDKVLEALTVRVEGEAADLVVSLRELDSAHTAMSAAASAVRTALAPSRGSDDPVVKALVALESASATTKTKIDEATEARKKVTAPAAKCLKESPKVPVYKPKPAPAVNPDCVTTTNIKTLAKALDDVSDAVEEVVDRKLPVVMRAAAGGETYTARYLVREPAVRNPLFVTATQIVANEQGDGVLTVVIDPTVTTQPLTLQLSGGDVTGIAPALVRRLSGWTVTAGQFTLTLRNLSPLSEVKVSIVGDDGKVVGRVVDLKVVQSASKK